MRLRNRIVVMDPPVPSTTREFYQGSDGWKGRPDIGEEVIVADVGGSGKLALGKVVDHDKSRHTFTVYIIRDYSYAEEDEAV